MQPLGLLLGGPVREPLYPDAERRPGRAAEGEERPQRQARPLLRPKGQGLQTPHESGIVQCMSDIMSYSYQL